MKHGVFYRGALVFAAFGLLFVGFVWGLDAITRTLPADPTPVAESGRRGSQPGRRELFRASGVELFGLAKIEGKVALDDPEGDGVQAAVTLVRVMPGGGLEPVRTSQSSASGRFGFSDLPRGRYRINAFADGIVGQGVGSAIEVGDADVHHVTVVVTRGGRRVFGVVEDRLGGELEGALVSFQSGPTAGRWEGISQKLLTTVTDGYGRFELTVPGGLGRVSARAAGYAAQSIVESSPGKEIHLALWPASAVSGTVVDHQQRAVPGAFVYLRDVAASGVDGAVIGHGEQVAVTNPSGQFTFSTVRPGPVQLHALAPVGVSVPLTVDAAAHDDAGPLRLVLEPAATIRGHVVAESKRRGLSGFEVSCRTAGRTVTAPMTTDEDGAFVIFGVKGDGCHLVAGSTAVRHAARRFVEIEGSVVDGVVLSVPVGGPVRGRVVPAAVATVQLLQTPSDVLDAAVGGRLLLVRSVVTSASGGFEFPYSPEQAFVVRAVAMDGRVGEVDLAVAADDVIVALEERQTLRGRILAEDPRATGGLVVVADGDHSVARATTDHDGGFTLKGLAPGTITIGVTDAAGRPLRVVQSDGSRGSFVTVDVEPQTEPEIWVEPRDGEIRGVVRAEGGEPVPFARLFAVPDRVPLAQRLGLKPNVARNCPRVGKTGAHPEIVADEDGEFIVRGLRRDLVYRVVGHRTDGRGFGCAQGVQPGDEVVLNVAAG